MYKRIDDLASKAKPLTKPKINATSSLLVRASTIERKKIHSVEALTAESTRAMRS
ncbi:MAG: hypothetical protein UZ22_OP11002000601 [Microgenomates bacterium OLB23]|nr:MAG: hypothetical protein UZ22_OP11002000601 [Microgenomates bacterium OLB23]